MTTASASASAAASATATTLDRPVAGPISDRWPPWALLASGLLLTLVTGPRSGVAVLGWVALVPYLVYARRARGAMAWIWLFEALFAGHCLQFAALATPSVPMAAVLGFGPPLAILRFGAIGIAERARRRIGERAGVVAFASSTLMIDWLAYATLGGLTVSQ